MGVQRDQADGLLRFRVSEPLDDARRRYAVAGGAGDLEADQLAVLGVAGGATRHGPFLQLLLIDGIDDAAAVPKRAEDAEQAARGGARQALDSARLIGIVGVRAERGDTRQHAVADARGRPLILLALDHEDARGRSVLVVPGGGPGANSPSASRP
ncbi:hypothetical protein AUC71_09275 [Methyloceanibacter marginalis]|uniref:Uncharacterized protein n=1 Tax=Methyloceanibacter marginalis TaxID=1774971 RepID=A0A1E3WCH7_9HYPH|nr:hypothetical protein AUC71_09275 [Methyloceanibacter marginalis]